MTDPAAAHRWRIHLPAGGRWRARKGSRRDRGAASGTTRSGPASIAPDGELIRRTRWRLVAWSGAITLVILVVLGTAIATAVARSLSASSEALLRTRADLIINGVRGSPGVPAQDGTAGGQPLGFVFGGGSSGTIALIVGPGDTLLAPRDLRIPGLPLVAGVTAARTTNAVDIRDGQIANVPIRVLSEPVSQFGQVFVVQIVADRSAEERTVGLVLLVLAVGGIGALLLALVGGRLYAERALVPIRDSLQRQRDFAADASHELRTPLTVVRSSVEHLLRHPESRVGEVGSTLEDIDAEVGRLGRLVDDLLLLARADSGAVEVQSLPVDVGDLAATVLGSLAPLATDRGVRLALDAGPATVAGDPDRLRQLITILADNAIRHGPAGGTVTVSVSAAARRVLLVVEDEGPGIPEADRAQVFERFWRGPGAADGGSGLGLSIARWIATIHAGTIRLTDRAGGGARFEVSLPAA